MTKKEIRAEARRVRDREAYRKRHIVSPDSLYTWPGTRTREEIDEARKARNRARAKEKVAFNRSIGILPKQGGRVKIYATPAEKQAAKNARRKKTPLPASSKPASPTPLLVQLIQPVITAAKTDPSVSVLPVLQIAKPSKKKIPKVWPVITSSHIWCTVQFPEPSGKGWQKESQVAVLPKDVATVRSHYQALGAKFYGPLK